MSMHEQTSRQAYLKSLIDVIPDKPGVYQYFDKEGKLLYIGKAKNLKKRVSSYFSRTEPSNYKLHVLQKKIANIEHIVVATESDALLLENNLVKKHQPRYNVMLKDDKTFPWICVKNEPFPRVFSTRNVVRDGSVYYGPYTSGFMVKTILELTRQLYPLRTCKLNLSKENIEKGKYKVCLEYHMGNCMAPCVGLQEESEYNVYLEQVHQILKGNIKLVISRMKAIMKEYASLQDFENAQMIKEKINVLEKYRSKSTIVNPRINNVDVFSIAQDKDFAFVNYLKVMNGSVIQAHTVEIKKRLNESTSELLTIAIVDIREKIQSNAREIIIPEKIEIPLKDVSFIVPQRGDKKHLLELSERNAKYHQLEKKKRKTISKAAYASERITRKLQKDLRLRTRPVHIECFDNSNMQGANPVAACVVFKNARPSKKEYRHYHIKTVSGQDDFASMKEVVHRRYQRLTGENAPLPQLVIVDGGKGQLNAAVKGLEQLNIRGKIAIVGIAKKLEEIYFPGDPVPLYLDKNSESLKIIQQLRNEAHRFGINFHRKQRTKNMVGSELDMIEGVGEKTKEALILKFGSVKKIKQADTEELTRVVGGHKASLIKSHFLRSTT